MIRIAALTEAMLREHAGELCRIEAACAAASGGRYRNSWTREQFAAALPGKWTYSRIIFEDDRVVGFYIASQKLTSDGVPVLHGHNVAVLPGARTPNLLHNVYDEMFDEARRNGLRWFTGYQPDFNPTMMQWYVRLLKCRVVTQREEIERFVGPLSADVFLEADGRMRSPSGTGQYLIVRPLAA